MIFAIILACGSMGPVVHPAVHYHERAHAVARHAERAERKVFWRRLLTFGLWDVPKGPFRGEPLPWSVEFEKEADEIGLELMAKAGHDPETAIDYWTRHYDSIGWWEGDGTHPEPHERIENLKRAMPRAKAIYVEVKKRMPNLTPVRYVGSKGTKGMKP